MEVAHNESPRYGQHYSAEQVAEIFAPAQSSVDSVRDWLESSGISRERISQSMNKQWLQFDAEAEEMEKLLLTEFHAYEHVPSGSINVACEQYHVPKHVSEHIDYITPGIKLFTLRKERLSSEEQTSTNLEKRTFGVTSGKGSAGILPPILSPLPITINQILGAAELATCDTVITPSCIRALYNVSLPAYTTPIAGNELGVFEDLNDKYSQTDLSLFWTTFSQNIPAGTGPKLEAIDGATSNVPVTQAGPESDLDFQISYPLIYPQQEILFQTDDDPTEANYTYEGFLNNFLDAIDGSYCSYSAFGETGNSNLDPPYPDAKTGKF